MERLIDVATCMYYTGIDPFTKKEVFIARQLKDRNFPACKEIGVSPWPQVGSTPAPVLTTLTYV